MMARSRIVFVVIYLFVGLLVCSSKAQAIFLLTKVTGGANLGLYSKDWTDGWAGDYEAEATHNSPVSPHHDQGYAKASLTEAGVELKSRSYAPDVHAHGFAKILDTFTVETMTGTAGTDVNAVLNFVLTGNIEVLNAQDSKGHVWVNLAAWTSGHVFSRDLQVYYDVSWDSSSNQYIGYNHNEYNEDWDDLFQVNPTVTGSTYNFDVPLSLNLEGLPADEMTYVQVWISTFAGGAITDFSNTLKTDPDNPFVITSSPPGSTYILETDYSEVDGVGLFGNLDGEIVGGSGTGDTPIPEPATILLLGTGLVGIAGITRRKLKK